MAKELPYFKFEPSEWQNGNIQMCSELTQLYFINMCCTYWSKLGSLNKKLALIKCFDNEVELFNELIENKIIFIDEEGEISISFLDKQLAEFKIKKNIKSESGRKGGLNNGVRPEIERTLGNQLYLLECWNNEERFYKMGITTSSISRRYSGKIQYQYKVVFQVFTDKFIEAEKELCELLRNYEYTPLLNFAGQKECYLYSENQSIENIINNYFNFAKVSLKRNDAIREDKIKEDKIREEEIIKKIESDFNIFWDSYGKKVDSKKCREKFFKLSRKDIDKILEVVDEYIKSTPDDKFRKNPLTWLNGSCWNDVVYKKNIDTKKKYSVQNAFGRDVIYLTDLEYEEKSKDGFNNYKLIE